MDGDDYAARVYLISVSDTFFWRTRASSYVWSSEQQKGSSWDSPYSKNIINISTQSGQDKIGQWTLQKRNVREDFNTFSKEDIKEISGIALMTDTDNTSQIATAFYGNIEFSDSC